MSSSGDSSYTYDYSAPLRALVGPEPSAVHELFLRSAAIVMAELEHKLENYWDYEATSRAEKVAKFERELARALDEAATRTGS